MRRILILAVALFAIGCSSHSGTLPAPTNISPDVFQKHPLQLNWTQMPHRIVALDPVNDYRILYAFQGGADGGNPVAGLIRDASGNLYGTTPSGGVSPNCPNFGCGEVFKIDSSGKKSVFYNFNGSDGKGPGALIQDANANFYGTAGGGSSSVGVVFEIDPNGNETGLYSFSGPDGCYPTGVTMDAAGNLYGTTAAGGGNTCNLGGGVVFKLEPNGVETVLHMFTNGPDGNTPDAGVVLDAAGDIYGTTSSGGPSNNGAIFELDPSGNEILVIPFDGVNGSTSRAKMIKDDTGNLYGTTCGGGT